MKVGDIVMIRQSYPLDWLEANGKVGIVTAIVKRLYIPGARVMVLGEEAEFDMDELELVVTQEADG